MPRQGLLLLLILLTTACLPDKHKEIVIEKYPGGRVKLVNIYGISHQNITMTKEIGYWDHRALELAVQESAGRINAALNSAKARQRADELTARLHKRLEELAEERRLAPLPPVVFGGALVVPQGLLDDFLGALRTAYGELFSRIEDNPDVVAVINARHLQRVEGYVQDARDRGARIESYPQPLAVDEQQRRRPAATHELCGPVVEGGDEPAGRAVGSAARKGAGHWIRRLVGATIGPGPGPSGCRADATATAPARLGREGMHPP